MAPSTSFELYAFWRTSATYRVRVALGLKGIEVRERLVDVDAGEHLGEAFLRINPMGAIPALIEAGHAPLTQSLAIMEFLEELQPEPALLPKDLHGRARVRSIAGMLAGDTHPLVVARVRRHLAASRPVDDAAWRAWQTHWFHTGLSALEERLKGDGATGTFCHGEQPTIADICLASIIVVMRVFNIPTSNTPTVDRVMRACEQLEAFRRAEPHRQAGAPRG